MLDVAPSGIINAAAYTAVDRAEEDEALATRINGDAPAAMAQAAARLGVPFVHISTDYVFDGAGKQPVSPEHPDRALGRLRALENWWASRVSRRLVAKPLFFAHILGVFGAWQQFRQDNAAPWRRSRQADRCGRPDRRPNACPRDIAAACLTIFR